MYAFCEKMFTFPKVCVETRSYTSMLYRGMLIERAEMFLKASDPEAGRVRTTRKFAVEYDPLRWDGVCHAR
jgi:hypothetical protein